MGCVPSTNTSAKKGAKGKKGAKEKKGKKKFGKDAQRSSSVKESSPVVVPLAKSPKKGAPPRSVEEEHLQEDDLSSISSSNSKSDSSETGGGGGGEAAALNGSRRHHHRHCHRRRILSTEHHSDEDDPGDGNGGAEIEDGDPEQSFLTAEALQKLGTERKDPANPFVPATQQDALNFDDVPDDEELEAQLQRGRLSRTSSAHSSCSRHSNTSSAHNEWMYQLDELQKEHDERMEKKGNPGSPVHKKAPSNNTSPEQQELDSSNASHSNGVVEPEANVPLNMAAM